MGGWGWLAGSIETKAISASNLKLKLKLTEAELGNKQSYGRSLFDPSHSLIFVISEHFKPNTTPGNDVVLKYQN